MHIRNASKYWSLALLAASAVVVWALGAKHRVLSQEVLKHRRDNTRLQRDMYVPVFSGLSVDGDSITIGQPARGQRQVLMLLTSTCPYCRASLGSWAQMTARLQGAATLDAASGIVAITPEADSIAETYAGSNAISFPLIALPTRRLMSLYRAHVIPQTIVIDHEGKVVYARHGVFNTEAAVDSVVEAVLQSSTPSFTAAALTARGAERPRPVDPQRRGIE